MAKKNEISIRSSAAEYLSYVASVGDQPLSVELRYEDENIWLTQRLMAELYGVDLRTVNDHIEKIFRDGELVQEATIRKFRIVQKEGERFVNRELLHYNLQMIIAVGFKVNNERAVQFRKWANGIVKEYTIKGWVMDDVRLKEGCFLTKRARPFSAGLFRALNGQGLILGRGPCAVFCLLRPSGGQGPPLIIRPCPLRDRQRRLGPKL